RQGTTVLHASLLLLFPMFTRLSSGHRPHAWRFAVCSSASKEAEQLLHHAHRETPRAPGRGRAHSRERETFAPGSWYTLTTTLVLAGMLFIELLRRCEHLPDLE